MLSFATATKLASNARDRIMNDTIASSGVWGKFWSSLPTRKPFSNDHFRAALLLQLGELKATRGTTCQMKNSKDDPCGCCLTDPLAHLIGCQHGPAKLRPQSMIKVALRKALMKLRIQADEERVVPELFQVRPNGTTIDAILDIVVLANDGSGSIPLDVIVRSPHTTRTGVTEREGMGGTCG